MGRILSLSVGRRGFDDKGQIIFFGVPPNKACRLISAPLPSVTGSFAFTVGTILRLLFKFKLMEGKKKKLYDDEW